MKNVLGKTQAEVKEKLKEKIEEAKVLTSQKRILYGRRMGCTVV